MLLEDLRKELIFYGRQMLHSGLTMHTGGNLSARDSRTGLIVIKPTSLPYDTMEPEDVPVIDENGKKIDGRYEPSSEWPMHTMIYRRKPRVMGVIHTHSVYATACSAAGMEIPILIHEIGVYSSKPIKIAPFADPGTVTLGERALEYLDDSDVVILQNHGPLAIGATLWHAFDAACAVEQAAFTLLITKILGNCVPIPPEGLKALRAADPLQQPDMGTGPVIKSV